MQVLICYSSNVFFFITAGRSSFLWIDANDIMVEGEWRSSDGSLLTYTGFHPTEPNLGTADNCAIILIDYLNYQWADISCDALCPFACEIISF